jgi:predicted negative regulator of RcsB-dependent stress response
MKAEHRKELQTNTLSATLASWLESLRAGPTTGSVIFWAFILLAIGCIVGWRYYSASALEARSALWTKVENATSPKELLEIAEANPGTPAARAARFESARLQLRQGLEKILSNLEIEREEAWKDVKAAEEEYGRLAAELTEHPVLVQEALFGLAKAREGQGNIDGALEAYEKLTKKYGETPLGKIAAEQMDKLKANSDQAKEFYAKLREIAPPPAKTTPEKPEK